VSNERPLDYYRSLPKIELHRHLEGSLRLRTLLEIGRAHGVPLPGTGRLRELVQIGEEDTLTFENFLSKFQTLRMFYRSPEAIHRITQETIADAAEDNIRYMELRFTPIALSRAENFPLAEVIDWVIAASAEAQKEYPIKVRLIVSVNRHESADLASEIVKLAIDRRHLGIVGIDLAGNEAEFSGMAFLGVFKEARQAGMKITIHAGEWGGAENVMNAILYLGADRIGHGVRVMEDPTVVALARERGIPFEVCVTSNYQSGVVPSVAAHPLTRMIQNGLRVTLNTDDPSISKITLSDEYRLAENELGLSPQTLRDCVITAAQAAFLPQEERDQLVQNILESYPMIA
jgi:adenosine deaminase